MRNVRCGVILRAQRVSAQGFGKGNLWIAVGMIVFECPNCSSSISVEDDHAGRRAWCRKCRRISTVPRPQQSTRATAPSPASVAIGAPIAALGSRAHASASAIPVHQPISGITGRPAEWNLRQASEPIDLKHIQPAAREEVRINISEAA